MFHPAKKQSIWEEMQGVMSREIVHTTVVVIVVVPVPVISTIYKGQAASERRSLLVLMYVYTHAYTIAHPQLGSASGHAKPWSRSTILECGEEFATLRYASHWDESN